MEKLGKIDIRASKTDLSKFCIRNLDCFLKSVKEVQSKDTLIVFALQDNATRYLKESDVAQLQSFGLKADILGKGPLAYIAVLTDKPLFEASGNERIENEFTISGLDIFVRSATGSTNLVAVAINGAERSKAEDGFNIVVYDLKKRSLLVQEAFATHKKSRRRQR